MIKVDRFVPVHISSFDDTYWVRAWHGFYWDRSESFYLDETEVSDWPNMDVWERKVEQLLTGQEP